MKSIIFKISTLLLLTLSFSAAAQVHSNQDLEDKLDKSNYFLDASLFQLGHMDFGKLLGFPHVDLSEFVFDTSIVNQGLVANNFFDGVLVYNTSKGMTKDGQGIKKQLSPGFYYFSNPTKNESGIATGEWKSLGGMNYTDTETITNTVVGGMPVYSITGTFKIDGIQTQVQLHGAPDITSLFRITIFNGDKGVYATTLYKYDPKTGEAVTGSPGMSVIYENGTYNYLLEYFKNP